MDIRILIGVLGTFLVSTVAITVSDTPPTENPFVPGVFIAADALKNLQDQAKSKGDGLTRTEGQSDITTPASNEQIDDVQQMPVQPNQQMGNQYPNQQPGFYPNQQTGYPNQQMGYPDQQIGYPDQQMGYPNQQMGYPNQQMGYPNRPMQNQPYVFGNRPMGYENQPRMFEMQPGYQQNGQNPQGYPFTNPSYQQPGFINQPQYQNPQGVYGQTPPYNQPPNNQYFNPYGQSNQPNMVGNPNFNGPQTFQPNNPNNGGDLYAMLPVNGQNPMGNPNLGNNIYFGPGQQMPENTRDKARK